MNQENCVLFFTLWNTVFTWPLSNWEQAFSTSHISLKYIWTGRVENCLKPFGIHLLSVECQVRNKNWQLAVDFIVMQQDLWGWICSSVPGFSCHSMHLQWWAFMPQWGIGVVRYPGLTEIASFWNGLSLLVWIIRQNNIQNVWHVLGAGDSLWHMKIFGIAQTPFNASPEFCRMANYELCN